VLCGELGSKDKFVATGSADCTVRLWSPHSGQCLRVYRGHRHWVKCVRFASDAQALLSAGLDGAIFVWHLPKAGGAAAGVLDSSGALGAPRHVLLSHSGPVMDLRLLGGGARFVSAAKDLTLRVWDLRAGKEVAPPLANPAQAVPVALALAPDGRSIAAAFADHSINIYDAAPAAVDGEGDASGGAQGSAAPTVAKAVTGATALSSIGGSGVGTSGSAVTRAASAAGPATSGPPLLRLRRQLQVHSDGLISVSWMDRSALIVGTATGELKVLNL